MLSVELLEIFAQKLLADPTATMVRVRGKQTQVRVRFILRPGGDEAVLTKLAGDVVLRGLH